MNGELFIHLGFLRNTQIFSSIEKDSQFAAAMAKLLGERQRVTSLRT